MFTEKPDFYGGWGSRKTNIQEGMDSLKRGGLDSLQIYEGGDLTRGGRNFEGG